MPIKIFYCYAHRDAHLLEKLKAHLSPLRQRGIIDAWYDRDISAGAEWEQEIKEHLNAAQIILLLVSSDFIESNYCYSIEMERAIERHERQEARVIPIILRKCSWDITPLARLQALPTEAKPIKSWRDRDKAFSDVAQGIHKIVLELLVTKAMADYDIGSYEEARQAFEQAILLAQKDAKLYKSKGDTLRKLRRHSEALVAYQQAIDSDNNYAAAWCGKPTSCATR